MVLKTSADNLNELVAANFLLMMFGSALVTLNAKLIGLQHSFFFYVCVLGLIKRLFFGSNDNSSAFECPCWQNIDASRNPCCRTVCLSLVYSLSCCLLFVDFARKQAENGTLSGVALLLVLCRVRRFGLIILGNEVTMDRFVALNDWLFYDIPSPGRFPSRYVINAFKGAMLPFCIVTMVVCGTFKSERAIVYTALHGSYGIIWLLKDLIFGDKNFAKQSTSASLAFICLGLSGYQMIAFGAVSK